MKAEQARKLTAEAIKRSENADEAKIQGALEVVFAAVQKAAENRKSQVLVPFNGTPKNPHPELLIGEWPMRHWDGGEHINTADTAQVLVDRLAAEGFGAEVHYNGLEVRWDPQPAQQGEQSN